MTGKAHVYNRDHINTDEIIPARYLNTDDRAELAKHCLEDLDADFVSKVEKGDCIVAGEDFGCGSSREHAVWSIRGAGVRQDSDGILVIDRSTGSRITMRNVAIGPSSHDASHQSSPLRPLPWARPALINDNVPHPTQN